MTNVVARKYQSPVERIEAYRRARMDLRPADGEPWFRQSPDAEGGCGVTGFACTIPVRGKHIYEPSIQMRNRGNGKGGGIAACGLVPEEMGVSRKVLDNDYLLQVAVLDPKAQGEVESTYIDPYFDIDQGGQVRTVDDYRDVPLLEVKPPDVARYFVRVKPDVLERFASEKGLGNLTDQELEDEFVFQNSIRLNDAFYSSKGEKRAFVLSHAKNLMINKIVGYAEAAVQYYCLEDTRAHLWIAHQRYPTRGRVWHPGGAHPFVGMNEALVHNGDFANYRSVSEYLAARNLFPKFLTDTEVSVLLFDLMHRVYKYPIEFIIEALAPTTELDFDRLPDERQRVYRQIQALHMHGSPDGPWFFIIARNLGPARGFQLVGITDTAMLRPQVFALQEGDVSVGLICSEKQAIDATLASLAAEDPRIMPVADRYWNARGGSFNDGGAFLVGVQPSESPADGRKYEMRVTNKFGNPVVVPPGVRCDLSLPPNPTAATDDQLLALDQAIHQADPQLLFNYLRDSIGRLDFDGLRIIVDRLVTRTADTAPALAIEGLTCAIDRRYPTGSKKRSCVLTILRDGLEAIFDRQPLAGEGSGGSHLRINWDTRHELRAPQEDEQVLLIDASRFAPEGEDCDARLAVAAYKIGWRNLIHYNSRGTRFHAAGFGPATNGLRIDCYDNCGDYLGSGIDGLEVYVHGNAQDQVGQITKCGKIVVFGDVGQTFLYGAKGGEIFVMGNAAGRPMINAVGRPKVVINGTALDFLAESFMAGDPLDQGGFAIVNGVQFDHHGNVIPLDMPYPGSNLLSLASGGAIYVRDPHRTLVDQQLNGGSYSALTPQDWKLILPFLEENQRLFGIHVERDLLTVDGILRQGTDVYRKVAPTKSPEIEAELAAMEE